MMIDSFAKVEARDEPNSKSFPEQQGASLALSNPTFSCYPITPCTPRREHDYTSQRSRSIVSFDQERGLLITLAQPPPVSTIAGPTSTTSGLHSGTAAYPQNNVQSPLYESPASIESSLASIESSPGELSNDDDELPSDNDEEAGSSESTQSVRHFSNEPNQMLETPPLYFVLKERPFLMNAVQRFYRFRWTVTYPLQRRVRRIPKLGHTMTWGELLLLLPFFATMIAVTVYTFAVPSVSVTGHCSRVPLIFAFVTAMKNSFITFLIGMPFDRAIFYHKLAGRIAFVNSLLHAWVAFRAPAGGGNFLAFLGMDTVNSAGTLLVVFMASLIITSSPIVRQKAYELFYYLHILYAMAMIGCAFYHTGMLVPILGSICWGVDLLVRKGIMALARYPRDASIRILSESVLEIRFPKSQEFDYNPGQYVLIAVPELSLFQWHPFSLSSSPCQKTVSLHIRKVGNWTTALYNLARQKSDIRILMEGPYGSLAVDLLSERYKSIMLISGGTGVAPMQSICNQIIYEQGRGDREPIQCLSFVWTERDPAMMNEVDVVRRSSLSLVSTSPREESSREEHENDLPLPPAVLRLTQDEPMGIASAMLTLVSASTETDEELENDLLRDESADEANGQDGHETEAPSNTSSRVGSGTSNELYDTDNDDDTVLDEPAYGPTASHGFLDLKVFLTADNASREDVAELPFVHKGRPNVKSLLGNLKEEAVSRGEKYVAVCVCAPLPLVKACRRACSQLSDRSIQFDLHEESFS